MLKEALEMIYKKQMLKILIVVIGTAVAALGMDMAIYAGFGSATLAVLWQGIAQSINITIGQASLIIAAAMVLFCLFYDRSQIHIGTILYQVIYSLCIDWFAPYIQYGSSKMINFLLMILGLAIFSLGSALYSVADFGKGSYEALTFAIVNKNKFSIQKVRIVLDILCVLVGVLLGGKVGLCTVTTILLSGVLLQQFVKLLKPIVNKFIN